jgi:hypothetical protein
MTRIGMVDENPKSSMTNTTEMGPPIAIMNPKKMVQNPIPALRVHTISSPGISPSSGGSNRVVDE